MKKSLLFTALTFSTLNTEGMVIRNENKLQSSKLASVNDPFQITNFDAWDTKKWVSKLVQMKQKGEDLNIAQNSKGQNILMLATQHANYSIMKQILNFKKPNGRELIDIDAQDKEGNTALMIAVKAKAIDKVRLLLDNEANINIKNHNGDTALVIAVSQGNREVEKLLFQYMADLDLVKDKFSKKRYNICKNIKNAVEFSRNALLDVLFPRSSSGLGVIMETQLFEKKSQVAWYSESSQDINLLKERLEKWGEINAPLAESGETLLHIAIYHNFEAIFDLLLQYPDIDINKGNEITPFIGALNKKRFSMARKLIKRSDLNIYKTTNNGTNPLIEAASKGYLEIVKELLKRGFDINVQNNFGATPLYVASSHGQFGTVEFLLNNGANPNLRTKQGASALMVASQNGFLNIVSKLISKGAVLNYQSNKGITALMQAARNRHIPVIKALLERCSVDDIKQYNCNKIDALWLAVNQDYEDVVELILKKLGNISASHLCNIMIKDNKFYVESSSIWSIARERGNIKIMELLRDHLESVDDDKKLETWLKKKIDDEINSIKNKIEETVKKAIEEEISQSDIDVGTISVQDNSVKGNIKHKNKSSYRLRKMRSYHSVPSFEKGTSVPIEPPKVSKNQSNDEKKLINEAFIYYASQGLIQDAHLLLQKRDDDKNRTVTEGSINKSLIIAAKNGNLPMINQFISYCSDINFKDENGNNPLLVAAKEGNFDIIVRLLSSGARINTLDKNKRTALMLALENEQLETAKILLKYGAKTSIKDKYDKTALDIINDKIEKLTTEKKHQYVAIGQILSASQSEDEVEEHDVNEKAKWKILIGAKAQKQLETLKKNSALVAKIKNHFLHMSVDPFQRNPGNVEKLKNNLSGLYSIELNDTDRLIYHVDSENIRIISCKGHYDDIRKTTTKKLLREFNLDIKQSE